MSFGDDVIAFAGKYMGTPYAWGGGDNNGPTRGIRDGGIADRFGDFNKVGFDCSGLVKYAIFQASGGKISLPHRADIQRRLGTEINGSAAPGDIIAFSRDGVFYHHIGIYLGNGMLRNAPQSGSTVSDMPLSNWSGEKQIIRRFGEGGSIVKPGSNSSSEKPASTGETDDKWGGAVLLVAIAGIAIVGLILIGMGGS